MILPALICFVMCYVAANIAGPPLAKGRIGISHFWLKSCFYLLIVGAMSAWTWLNAPGLFWYFFPVMHIFFAIIAWFPVYLFQKGSSLYFKPGSSDKSKLPSSLSGKLSFYHAWLVSCLIFAPMSLIFMLFEERIYNFYRFDLGMSY